MSFDFPELDCLTEKYIKADYLSAFSNFEKEDVKDYKTANLVLQAL